MSDKEITHLLIDTSYLFKFGPGFSHPDFMKLLRCSTVDRNLKIYIPHIVWEERRTQLVEEALACRRKLNERFDLVNRQLAMNIVLRGLTSPTLNVWSEDEIDAWSREAMRRFADENKIEVVSFAADHAERAWQRYFNVHPPFNRDEKRENRRKDIPDSWILETAIDLVTKHPGLLALVPDGKLSRALQAAGVQVFSHPQQVLDKINGAPAATKEVSVTDAISLPMTEVAVPTAQEHDELAIVLRDIQNRYKDLDSKILGYVGYFGNPSKDQLFTLLSRAGIPIEIARNVTERLVIAGVIMDTGNHYLARNRPASDLAASSIEPEIIKLLEET